MIYHVATSEDWELHNSSSSYHPKAYSEEGFIHCSTKKQVADVLQRYYTGHKNLILLHIEESKLTALLNYEKSTDGELFPHVLGVINKEAIVKTENL